MELFHEYKNKYFHLVLKILNSCRDGLEKEDIIKIIEDEEYEEKLITKDFKTFEGMILNEYEDNNLNLLKNKGQVYYSVLSSEDRIPIKIRFSNIEKTWLKGMLEDERARKFLGEKITNILEKNLEDVKEGSNKIIEFTNKNTNEFECDMKKLTETFFKILNAIKNNKLIKYTNVDRNKNEYKDKIAVPLRIEYSIKDDKLRASVYSVDENRDIMINLHTLKKVDIIEENFDLNRDEIIRKIKERKYCEEPVTIILKDKKGAMERCFMSFSSFERSSKLIDKDTYEIDIYYYAFQETEVISKIMSLGPYVTVMAPEKIRKCVIEKIKKAIEIQ